MWTRIGRGMAVMLLAIILREPVYGGELRDFEKDVTNKDSSKESPRPSDKDRDDHTGSNYGSGEEGIWGSLYGNVVAVIPLAIIGGGVHSWQRVAPGGDKEVEPRRPNEPLIPFVRGDTSYLAMNGDIKALNGRVEAGYGPFAIEYDLLNFEEKTGDELEVRRFCGLYRMSFGKQVEVDLGIGSMTLEGAGKTSEVVYTTPVLIYPTDRWGIEFRPAWAQFEGSTLEDYDLGVFLNWKGASLKAGYRWLRSDNEDLRGPYLGLVFRY